jgi:hypothetical protein
MKIVWENPIQHVALHQGLGSRYWPDVSETDEFAVIAIMKANRALRVGHYLRAEIEHSVMTSLTKPVCHMDPSIAFLYWLLLLLKLNHIFKRIGGSQFNFLTRPTSGRFTHGREG